MAEVLQFHCPACGGLLQIPASGAGMRGPCPQCHHPIIAPDPLRGIPAFMLAVAPTPAPEPVQVQAQAPPPPPSPPVEEIPVATIPPPAHVEPPAPFVQPASYVQPITEPSPQPLERPPVAIPEPPPAPIHVAPAVAEPTAPPAASSRSGLAAALLIGGLVAALAFAGGYQSARQPAAAQPSPVATANPAAIEPATPKAKIVEEPSSEPPLPTAPALAAPRAALESFLTAPNWTTRAEFVLYPDRVRPRMEAYYASHPDKPTPWSKLEIEHCEVIDSTGFLLSVFRVHTAAFPKGYPVAVAETAGGWRVDWTSFIEYQDDLFQQFVAATGEAKGTFHLIVRQALEPSKTTDRIDFEVIPFTAPKGAVQKASVAKDSPAVAQLAEVTMDGNVGTLVLQLARHMNPDGTKRLEIISVPATNWRPREE